MTFGHIRWTFVTKDGTTNSNIKSSFMHNFLQGDSMERYPERCFHIIAPGQPKFDFNTSSISPLYETSYKNIIFYYKQIKSCPCHNDVSF